MNMVRLSYIPQDTVEPAELVRKLRLRPGGQLLDVERMMLHSPALTQAWNGFFGGIKSGMALTARLRELIACAVGSINGATYQYQQHAAAFLAAGGNLAQHQALVQPDLAASNSILFDATEQAALQMALEMTREIRVSDLTFIRARNELGSDQAMVELVGVIAGYNLVSRFLIALEIGETAGLGAPPDLNLHPSLSIQATSCKNL